VTTRVRSGKNFATHTRMLLINRTKRANPTTSVIEALI